MENLQTKIKKLQKKIELIRQKTSGEVHESYKQAAQTQEIIENLEKQIVCLKEKTKQNILKTFTLKSDSGETKEFKLVESNPEPSLGIISIASPIGKKLLDAKVGTTIIFQKEEYKVISIN